MGAAAGRGSHEAAAQALIHTKGRWTGGGGSGFRIHGVSGKAGFNLGLSAVISIYNSQGSVCLCTFQGRFETYIAYYIESQVITD